MRILSKLLIMLGFVLSSVFSTAWAGVARVDAVGKGASVSVLRAGGNIRLHKGDELLAGDEISTDEQTAVDLRLDDDTLIRVGVNSAYKVEESSRLSTLLHRLLKGAVRVLVKKNYEEAGSQAGKVPADGVKFRLYTPEGTVGVRGTEFVVARVNGGTELSGISGEVMFGPAETEFTQSARFVKVGRGFRSRVESGGAPAKPANYPLDSYLKQLDGPGGMFGPLVARAKGGNLRQRSEEPPASGKAVASSALSVKAVDAPRPKVVAHVPSSHGAQQVDYQHQLMQAAQAADLATARDAIAHGARIDGRRAGFAALHVAALNYQVNNEAWTRMMQFFMESKADMNVKDEKDGRTPLMLVATEEDKGSKIPVDLAKGLIFMGASLDATDNEGNTALALARKSKYAELVSYLENEAAADFERGREARAKAAEGAGQGKLQK